MRKVRLVIIGGGPAGLAAALGAKRAGEDDILILERDKQLGGILNQCIHNGFGLHTFHEELTGPEYAARFICEIKNKDILYSLNTMVTNISKDKIITAVNPSEGLFQIQAQAIILAMGCTERPRGALNIPGTRPAGIYTAGTAQKFVNVYGLMPGKEAVILGSGDIGLIMARRMTLEGAKVKMVVEKMPYSSGLKRNIVQCLEDFEIPLKLSHTVVDIEGNCRLEAVWIAQVKEGRILPETRERISCDTLLLSCGLIPENELSAMMGIELSDQTKGPKVNESLETNIPGVFACGNVLHVHDLVDFVSQEASMAGRKAVEYLREPKSGQKHEVPVKAGNGVRYTVPSRMCLEAMESSLPVRFRVDQIYKDGFFCVYGNDQRIMRRPFRIATPGEMVQILLTKKQLEGIDLQRIRIELEAEINEN